MTTFSLNGEIEKTLGYAKKISRVADNWLTNGLLPNLEDLKELKSDIGEIERGLESTRDEIQKRERLGPGRAAILDLLRIRSKVALAHWRLESKHFLLFDQTILL